MSIFSCCVFGLILQYFLFSRFINFLHFCFRGHINWRYFCQESEELEDKITPFFAQEQHFSRPYKTTVSRKRSVDVKMLFYVNMYNYNNTFQNIHEGRQEWPCLDVCFQLCQNSIITPFNYWFVQMVEKLRTRKSCKWLHYINLFKRK